MLTPIASLVEVILRHENRQERQIVLNRFHPKPTVEGDTFKLVQDFWDGITKWDLKPFRLSFQMKTKRSRGAKVAFVEALSTKYKAIEMIRCYIRLETLELSFGQKWRLHDLFWSWLYSGVSFADVFWTKYRPVGDKLSIPKLKLLFLEFISRGYKPPALPSFKAEANDLAEVESIFPLVIKVMDISGAPVKFCARYIRSTYHKDGLGIEDSIRVTYCA